MRYCKNKKGYLPINGKERVYIHYGSSEYDIARLWYAVLHKRHQYDRFGKPHGLWASPEKSDLSWKDWCEDNDFCVEKLEKSFKFKLSPNAKILNIYRLKDAYRYIIIEEEKFISNPDLSYTRQKLDLTEIYHHYDGIEVIMSNDYNNLHNNEVFYTWDVDSICVWSPDVIIPVK